VAPFPDAIGRDPIVQWPSVINMQFYWHAVAPFSSTSNRPGNEFIRSFVGFARGTIVPPNAMALGAEIGRLCFELDEWLLNGIQVGALCRNVKRRTWTPRCALPRKEAGGAW
jgi:hypothetical protein